MIATKGWLNQLPVKQKQSIRKIYDLPYREQSLYYFTKARILQLPELIQYMTLCYIKSGLVGPVHIHSLWKRLASERGEGRYSDKMLTYGPTSRQWLHNLARIAQVKLWNAHIAGGLETVVPQLLFKQNIYL